jgi:hypothetical protein
MKKNKRPKIKDILEEWWKEGIFNEGQRLSDVVEKLCSRGFTIESKKKGLVARLLTEMCQEGKLQRELLLKESKKIGKEKWLYKTLKNA